MDGLYIHRLLIMILIIVISGPADRDPSVANSTVGLCCSCLCDHDDHRRHQYNLADNDKLAGLA